LTMTYGTFIFLHSAGSQTTSSMGSTSCAMMTSDAFPVSTRCVTWLSPNLTTSGFFLSASPPPARVSACAARERAQGCARRRRPLPPPRQHVRSGRCRLRAPAPTKHRLRPASTGTDQHSPQSRSHERACTGSAHLYERTPSLAAMPPASRCDKQTCTAREGRSAPHLLQQPRLLGGLILRPVLEQQLEERGRQVLVHGLGEPVQRRRHLRPHTACFHTGLLRARAVHEACGAARLRHARSTCMAATAVLAVCRPTQSCSRREIQQTSHDAQEQAQQRARTFSRWLSTRRCRCSRTYLGHFT